MPPDFEAGFGAKTGFTELVEMWSSWEPRTIQQSPLFRFRGSEGVWHSEKQGTRTIIYDLDAVGPKIYFWGRI